MSGILRLESLTKGNTLKQGDKTPLKYKLFDADGENLNIAGKSAQVRLVYPDFLNIGYEKDGLTVAQDDTVTFTVDSVIPSRIYHVEIIVDDQFIFPSRADESKFTVDKSTLGTEANIIEIVGKDILIREVKSQVDTELQPLVTSLESAQQAEIQRASEESSRVSAEEQRKTDHANRSAELDGKADKVVIKNLVENGDFSDGVDGWSVNASTNYEFANGGLLATPALSGSMNRVLLGVRNILPSLSPENVIYVRVKVDSSSQKNLRTELTETSIGSGVTHTLTNVIRQGQNTISTIHTGKSSTSTGDYYNHLSFDVTNVEDDYSLLFKEAQLINLTETFGAGNEPTKEEMDELIKDIGYIDSENGVNIKEMFGYLMRDIRENTVLADGSVTKTKLDSTLQTLVNDLEAVFATQNENWEV